MNAILLVIGAAIAVLILRKVTGTGHPEPPPPPPPDWPAGATWPPVRQRSVVGTTIKVVVTLIAIPIVLVILLMWIGRLA